MEALSIHSLFLVEYLLQHKKKKHKKTPKTHILA